MKVIYDKEQDAYRVEFEKFEPPLFINTNDIVEAREFFIKHMTFLFNDTVREQLKDQF